MVRPPFYTQKGDIMENKTQDETDKLDKKCPRCSSNLIPLTESFDIYKCSSNFARKNCGALWHITKKNGMTYVKNLDEKLERQLKQLYRTNMCQFHLDFIPDWLCNEIDCMDGNENLAYCSKSGCPIKKVARELLKLKISVLKDEKLDTSLNTKRAIKRRWDYLGIIKPSVYDGNVKFRIIYFERNENRITKIYEPFPHNRFDTELSAQQFLSSFLDSTDEVDNNYYISAVLVNKNNKKKVNDDTNEAFQNKLIGVLENNRKINKIIGSMRQMENKEFNKCVKEISRDAETLALEQIKEEFGTKYLEYKQDNTLKKAASQIDPDELY